MRPPKIQRNACVRWSGPATSEAIHIDEGAHVWTFAEVKGGTLVRTEETWTGDQAEADVNLSTEALGSALTRADAARPGPEWARGAPRGLNEDFPSAGEGAYGPSGSARSRAGWAAGVVPASR
ncbi:hypothetical protein [Streptomyces violaceusniger]|uniref:Uncharacterized protein n=1 Tax=Streptomyces violaceusniger TaxID=68280 RepID=A0A4D4LA67_STRVO|nr:hypothetical protein SVIO_087450 [Streptomyces violaceusniger]